MLRVGEVSRQHRDNGGADQAVDPRQFFAHPVITVI